MMEDLNKLKNFVSFLYLCIALCACDGDEPNEPPLPPMSDLEDICSAMDDIIFIDYCYANFDTEGNGKISLSEAQDVKEIEMNGDFDKEFSIKIKSLKGIQYFSNLEKLKLSSLVELTSLDVSNFKKLKYLDIDNNALTLLDVSGLEYLETLLCKGSPIVSLNTKNCIRLKKIHCFPCQLTSIDVSGCVNLMELDCCGNGYYFRNQLLSLDLSDCRSLSILNCWRNRLTSLDVSKCRNLKVLWCGQNRLSSLDLTFCKKLVDLECCETELKTLNVLECELLNSLDCRNNPYLNEVLMSKEQYEGIYLTKDEHTQIKLVN